MEPQINAAENQENGQYSPEQQKNFQTTDQVDPVPIHSVCGLENICVHLRLSAAHSCS
jgi:hypothetical protein